MLFWRFQEFRPNTLNRLTDNIMDKDSTKERDKLILFDLKQ